MACSSSGRRWRTCGGTCLNWGTRIGWRACGWRARRTTGRGCGDDWLRGAGLKVFVDGGVGIGTALVREPYHTASGELSCGVQVIPTEKLIEVFRLANKYGLRMAQHDSGGAAIDLVLDCYEQINAERAIADRRF